jgi:hypothetical protein
LPHSIASKLVKFVFLKIKFWTEKINIFQKFQWHASLYIENDRFWEKNGKIGISLLHHCAGWTFEFRTLCPNKKLFLWSHDFEKVNFKMTARPLPVIPLKYTGVPISQPENFFKIQFVAFNKTEICLFSPYPRVTWLFQV